MTFWLLNSFFLFVDVTGMPSFVLKYKIQEDMNVPVSKDVTRLGLPCVCMQFVLNNHQLLDQAHIETVNLRVFCVDNCQLKIVHF